MANDDRAMQLAAGGRASACCVDGMRLCCYGLEAHLYRLLVDCCRAKRLRCVPNLQSLQAWGRGELVQSGELETAPLVVQARYCARDALR